MSALVAAFLRELSHEESDFAKKEREMLEVIAEIKDFKVGKRIPRDKLYER